MEDYGRNTISVGPWGGQDGFRWDDGVASGVRQLVICHGAGIDSIRIEYDDKGISAWSDKHGGSGDLKTNKVKLEYPDEFLTSIHGHYGSINEWGPVFVRSLTFESNKKIYGPYGIEQGTYFSFPMTGGKIVGFHGKCGWYLDAIGAYLEPLGHKPYASKSLVQSHYCANGTEKFNYSLVQGSLGNNYDVVLAFRQKNEYSYNSTNDLSRQTSSSREFSDTESKMPSVANSIERFPSRTEKGVVTYGAWGGTGGSVFDDGVFTGVRQIHLSRNVGIVSIRVLYEQNGEALWGGKIGRTGVFKTDKIIFDYPFEILTHISGFYGPAMIMGPTVIKSLTFHTTKTKYGPFGEEQGQQFTTNLREGKIVGFHGRKGLFLDAIGVHVVEGKVTPLIRPPSISLHQDEGVEGEITSQIRQPFNSSSQAEVQTKGVDKSHWSNKLALARRGPTDEVASRVVKEPAPCETGPWGGEGGRPWDDGVFSGVKQIYLTRKDAICSLQIEYDRNGQSIWSIKHGGNIGGTTILIKLDHPNEVLTCISGFYGPMNGDHGAKVVKSLTFTTSRRKCGPYGEEVGTFFTSITTEGKVVGFHGRSSMYLDAIGVHMQHWLGNPKSSKSSSLMKIFH
ncbi:Jacalin-related lectin like [Actinidia chinensis var. chinensis]|uniref:Jacalin-related lectin like n=1 Tax=Actinidia chinensis var. chinensis TaxID=1590841 RepID=A0A2R6RMU6_ACTCC|nr:Jacalin-related lectin like [Actinidia chinensis var. chinensis]